MPDAHADDQRADLLDAWLRTKLELPDGVSPDDIRRALMDRIESGEFATDDQLELAGCLYSGRSGLAESEQFAVEAQLRRRVDEFNRQFFSFPTEERRARLQALQRAVDGFPALQIQLRHSQDALLVDVREVERLDGTVRKLAELIVETYVLPQPERAHARREHLQEILAEAPPSMDNDNLEWRQAAATLMRQCPQIGLLDTGLLRSLGWSSNKRPALQTQREKSSEVQSPYQLRDGWQSRAWKGLWPLGVVVALVVAFQERHDPAGDPSYQIPPDVLRSIAPGDPGPLTDDLPPAVRQLQNELQTGQLRELSSEEIDRRFGDDPHTNAIKARLKQLVGPNGEPVSSILLSVMLPVLIESVVPGDDADSLRFTIPDSIGITVEDVPLREGELHATPVIGLNDDAQQAPAHEFMDAVRYIEQYHGRSIHQPSRAAMLKQKKQLETLLVVYQRHVDAGTHVADDLQRTIRRFRASHAASLALFHFERGESTQAMELIAAALKDVPDYPRLYECRSHLYFMAEDYDRAFADIDHAVRLAKDVMRYRFRRASLWEQLGDHQRAYREYLEIIERDPENFLAWRNRGISLQSSDPDRALSDLSRSLHLRPDQPDVLERRASLFLRQSSLDEALRDVVRTLRLAPKRYRGYSLRGEVLVRQGNLEAAYDDMTKAIDRAPDRAELWFNRASLQLLRKAYDEAATDLGNAAQLAPQSDRLFALRGRLLSMTGRLKESITAWSRAIELAPEDPNRWAGRADVLTELNRLDEALDDRETALGLAPKNRECLRQHGLILEKRGEFEFALEDWNEFIRLFPNDTYGFQRREHCRKQLASSNGQD